MPKVVAIIQARMGSTRLQGKSLLPLAGKPLVSHVIDRAKAVKEIDDTVLATCHGEENNKLVTLAEQMGIHSFVGSETDVLDRYYQAAKKHNADLVVRITGDNPFLDVTYASQTIQLALERDVAVCSIVNLPLGIAVETISMSSLERAYNESTKPYHREHVSPYIKEHSNIFRRVQHTVKYHNPFPDLRLTVDTEEDYTFAEVLFNNLYTLNPCFGVKEIVEFLEQHPEHLHLNSHIKQRSMTHFEKDL